MRKPISLQCLFYDSEKSNGIAGSLYACWSAFLHATVLIYLNFYSRGGQSPLGMMAKAACGLLRMYAILILGKRSPTKTRYEAGCCTPKLIRPSTCHCTLESGHTTRKQNPECEISSMRRTTCMWTNDPKAQARSAIRSRFGLEITCWWKEVAGPKCFVSPRAPWKISLQSTSPSPRATSLEMIEARRLTFLACGSWSRWISKTSSLENGRTPRAGANVLGVALHSHSPRTPSSSRYLMASTVLAAGTAHPGSPKARPGCPSRRPHGPWPRSATAGAPPPPPFRGGGVPMVYLETNECLGGTVEVLTIKVFLLCWAGRRSDERS